MAHQFSYDNRGGKPWPEKQFVDVLKDRKVGTLVGGSNLSLTCFLSEQREQLSKLDLADLSKKDIIIKIHLKYVVCINNPPSANKFFEGSCRMPMATLAYGAGCASQPV